MGKTVQVTCDGCGHDITTRSNMVDYRLVLSAEDKPGYGAGAYTAMHILPPVDRSHYFCGLQCLDHWRAREHHRQALAKAWWDKWRDERGTRSADGRITSYPVASSEVTKPLEAQWTAEALAAFPMKAANT